MKFYTLLISALLAAILLNCPASAQTSPDNKKLLSATWTIDLYEPKKEKSPTEGDPVKKNLASKDPYKGLYFTIGLFSQLVEVPLLKGKTWDEANVILSDLNLVAVKVSEKARKTDEVRNQDVAAGKKVAPGTRVRLDLVAKVPNVVGMTLAQAYELLEKENGFIMKYNKNWSSNLPVTVQKPEAGKFHRRGRDVEVASMVKVPDLIGMFVDQAKETLTESNLLADLPRTFSDNDKVLRQSTRRGKMVPALTKIKLTPGTEVPNLIGLDEAGADQLLRQAGIDGNPVYRRTITYDTFLHGRSIVDQQSIRAGNYVPRGTKMRVTLLTYVYQPPVIIRGGGRGNNGGGNNGGGNKGGGNNGGGGGGLGGGAGGG